MADKQIRFCSRIPTPVLPFWARFESGKAWGEEVEGSGRGRSRNETGQESGVWLWSLRDFSAGVRRSGSTSAELLKSSEIHVTSVRRHFGNI